MVEAVVTKYRPKVMACLSPTECRTADRRPNSDRPHFAVDFISVVERKPLKNVLAVAADATGMPCAAIKILLLAIALGRRYVESRCRARGRQPASCASSFQ